jgi:hypothetical protein
VVAQTKRNKAEERRAKAAALRKATEARTRRNRILIIVGAVVVVVVVVVVAVVVWPRGSATTAATSSGSQIIPATPTGAVTVQQKPTRVANKSGISGVLAWDTTGWPGDGAAHAGALEHDHVAGPVKYAVLPPVGGPHNPIWMNAGVYTKPIPSERAVHNLEHGAVWITYDPNLPAAEVTELTAFVSKQSMISEPTAESGSAVADQANRYIDLSPWSSNALPSPIVISAWGYQLRVTSPTDPRLQQFVDKFRHNATYSPEFGAAVDGVPIQTGGRPDLDGSKQPSPAGAAQ